MWHQKEQERQHLERNITQPWANRKRGCSVHSIYTSSRDSAPKRGERAKDTTHKRLFPPRVWQAPHKPRLGSRVPGEQQTADPDVKSRGGLQEGAKWIKKGGSRIRKRGKTGKNNRFQW